MDPIKEKLEQLRNVCTEKDSVEQDLIRISLLRDSITDVTTVCFELKGGLKYFSLPPELINKFATLIQTHLTSRREELIVAAEKIIGPIDSTELEPKENETAPLNQ